MTQSRRLALVFVVCTLGGCFGESSEPSCAKYATCELASATNLVTNADITGFPESHVAGTNEIHLPEYVNDGDYTTNHDFYHAGNARESWLRATFTEQQTVRFVRIIQRPTCETLCWHRLQGLEVYVGETRCGIIATATPSVAGRAVETVDCGSGLVGMYIELKKAENGLGSDVGGWAVAELEAFSTVPVYAGASCRDSGPDSGACTCDAGKGYTAAGTCEDCAAGTFKLVTGNDACTPCPEGFYCVGGAEDKADCMAAEGAYCPEGYVGGDKGITCPAGSYCAGETEKRVDCQCPVGNYCPAKWTPRADATGARRDGSADPLLGKRCPPNMFCPGGTAPPEARPGVCDLVQSCGDNTNATCGVRQSTFYKFQDDAADAATDGAVATCMKTADAVGDENPQWLRVDLGAEQLVATVRFVASGAAADFTVKVAAEDAAADAEVNPSEGGELPATMETCFVAEASAGVLEANCTAATKGQYVFVSRAASSEVLEVCELEVFAHPCKASAEVTCPMGFQPSTCTDEEQYCPGCVPCPEGTYSDKEGPYECTPCPGTGPYDERPYSPSGSTSEFQCEGDAVLDSTSTLEVDAVVFNQTLDAWHVDVAFSQGPKIQINGLSAFYMSVGGSNYKKGTYTASQFPCRADTSQAAGSDLSASLSETVCCLQDMRDDFLMTKIFRDFTDGLDLIAANDICDSEDGSDTLVNADLDVVGEGTFFVDTNGNSFANAITIEPIEAPATRRSNPEGYEQMQYARITIPDAELYKISRGSDGNLTDTRELFIGLLDMLPTGTRVVDSSSQQISISLTRTQYGTFAAYGEQNIDYDFISYLNARAFTVLNQGLELQDVHSDNLRREAFFEGLYFAYDDPPPAYASDAVHFAEISFVWDDRLDPADALSPVTVDSVMVNFLDPTTGWELDAYNPCTNTFNGPEDGVALEDVDVLEYWYEEIFVPVVNQQCGVEHWKDAVGEEVEDQNHESCPQVVIADDKFGRIYIPILKPTMVHPNGVEISFKLFLEDSEGRDASLHVAMTIVADEFVTYCDTAAGSIDLAERVIPSITIGTESANPPRLTNFGGEDPANFGTEAETLQDGLITLELALNETDGLDDNLEVFMEDVLVIQINPGSDVDVTTIMTEDYKPTYTYDPDTRDATLHIPDDLKTGCSNMSYSESFFGCVYKHVLAEEEITNPEWAYKVGSAGSRRAGHATPTSAQDFMETMLGDGTASVAARELGRDFEQYQVNEEGFATRKKIGLWINPGHVWGQTVHNSQYSLSRDVVLYVLFGVRSGVDGTTRRMLLQAGSDGRTAIMQTISYAVTAADVVEELLEDVVAVEVKAEMALSAEEACKPQEELVALCAEKLQSAVEPHASKVDAVHVVSVSVAGADCARRAASSPVATVDAVVALEKSAEAHLDIEAAVASGALLSLEESGGEPIKTNTPVDPSATPEPAEQSASGGGNNAVMIGAAAGAAVAVVVMSVVAWKASRSCKSQGEPLEEEVSTAGVMERGGSQPFNKGDMESILFNDGKPLEV